MVSLICLGVMGWLAGPTRPNAPSRAHTTLVRVSVHPRCSESEADAYSAGSEAVSSAASAQTTPQSRRAADSGKQYTVTLGSKPLGLVLGENPTGRGAFILEVLDKGAAAGRRELQASEVKVRVRVRLALRRSSVVAVGSPLLLLS